MGIMMQFKKEISLDYMCTVFVISKYGEGGEIFFSPFPIHSISICHKIFST